MARSPKLTTLPEQQRRQRASIDRGKKLAAGSLIGLGLIFLNWSSWPGFPQLAAAMFVFAGSVLLWLRQLSLRRFARLLGSLLLLSIGIYLAARGIALAALWDLLLTAAQSA